MTTSPPSSSEPPPPEARVEDDASRVTRREILAVVALLSVLLVLFFPDVVLGGRTLSSSATQWGVMGDYPPYGYPETGESRHPRVLKGGPDYNNYLADPLATAVGLEPRAEKLSRAYRSFQYPLWDPNMGGGRPMQAGWSPDLVSPIRLPAVLLNTPGGWDAFLLLRLVVAGLFTYLLCRRLDLARTAAVGAAVFFAFSGYFMLFINMPHVDFAMTLPMCLYAMELLVERGNGARLLFGASAIALGILSDNPRTAVIVVLFSAGYFVARMIVDRGLHRESLWRPLGRLGLAVGAGCLLTGFIVLPFLGLTDQSGFSAGVSSDAGQGLRVVEGRRLLSQVAPFFEGAPTLGYSRKGTDVNSYVGGGTVVLAFLGLWNRRLMRTAGWFFLGAGVLMLGKVYGLPLLEWVGRLPVLNVVTFKKYLPPAIALSLAILAGLGIDLMARGRWPRLRMTFLLGGIGVVLGLMVFLNRSVLSQERFGSALQLSVVGASVGAVLLTGVLARRGRVRPGRAAWLLVAVVAAELMFWTVPVKGRFLPEALQEVFERASIQTIKRPVRYDQFTEPPFVRFLREDDSHHRVFGFDRLLYPNMADAYDIQDIRYFSPTPLARYQRYVREFINPSLRGRFTGAYAAFLGSEFLPPKVAANPMFDLLNVKYVMSRRGRPAGLPPDQFHLVHRGPVNVYLNNHHLPRAFVVHDVRQAASEDAAIAVMREQDFDPARTAVVEGRLSPLVTEDGTDGTRSRARIIRYADDEVEIEVRGSRSGLLVLADVIYPGWEAFVDGRPARLHPTDLTLRGVAVPAGVHHVDFRFTPSSFAMGRNISFATLAGLLLYGASSWIRRRGGRLAVRRRSGQIEDG